MISRKLFWSLTLVLAVFGFTAGSLVGDVPEVRRSEAVWKEVFRTPSEMVRNVDSVVLARMIEARPGRVVRSAGDALPFEVVKLEVLRGFKGAAAGDRVLLERARLDFDGGAFEPGATYLLFLRQQEGGPYFYQVNHQGRFLVVDGRLWASAHEDAVAGFFEGRPVGQALRFVRQVLER
ncbi:MAG TPA: hypothetical protein VNM67_02580 [Thermoanaerobaculia bacterium]|jgi:hypothetical protein|nr:hypothetical protein [Thermoanaerobaculia bacterium]